MKLIHRQYLDKLIKVIGTPEIKVITGIRRSGKSILLSELINYVQKTHEKANIISIDFNSLEYDDIRDYKSLNSYVESHFNPKKENFIFIDEVQLCDGFERAINSLHASQKYDIYLTGSNAFLLSSDLATLFTGRAYPIEVFPFSFKEYLDYYPEKKELYQAFDDYFLDGGLSGSYAYTDKEEKYKYIEEVYNTIIRRDIVTKHNIQNVPTLIKVSEYLTDNISNLTTPRSIADTLTSAKHTTNNKTVSSYIDYLCNAFVFYPIKRYDVNGKNYLYSQEKYYLCDHAIKAAVLGTKNMNYGRIYENIVAIELLRRGYELYVGKLRNKEVDFVAKKRDEKIYIQVSYDIEDKQTFEREVTSLLEIRDAYPKIIIAHTRQPEYSHEGIKIIDIADWLAQKDEEH